MGSVKQFLFSKITLLLRESIFPFSSLLSLCTVCSCRISSSSWCDKPEPSDGHCARRSWDSRADFCTSLFASSLLSLEIWSCKIWLFLRNSARFCWHESWRSERTFLSFSLFMSDFCNWKSNSIELNSYWRKIYTFTCFNFSALEWETDVVSESWRCRLWISVLSSFSQVAALSSDKFNWSMVVFKETQRSSKLANARLWDSHFSWSF